MREVISTTRAPAAIGPYSQAIRCAGTLIFTAGQIGIVPETGEFAGDTVEEQARQALKNLREVLRAAGADLTNVVKTTVFLANIDDFARVNEIYREFFPEDPPARSAIGGLQLPKGAKVEIECVAVV
jgi:2-iminobutanoate/2-iminopropanoate deaminase